MSFLQEYTLLGELGQGGFAKVYKVRHNELGYIRAIRVLNEPVTDEKSRTYQKFLRECKVLLRLGNGTHPSIVHIYQPRLLENHALVEMDFVDGKDLIHYLDANGHFIPTDEVLRMVKEISSALAYCHEDIYRFSMDRVEDHLQDDPNDGSKVLIDEATRRRLIEKYKVIHNDIHSGNIIRREDGSFVLLDFGLAITGADDVRNSSRHENGAMEYKAPEKWDDDSILTEQSDIYSFGIVMYEYLAGRVPFPYDGTNSNRARSIFELSEAHKNLTPPSICSLRQHFFEEKHPGEAYEKDYPDWLEEAILKCLDKDPSKRFRNGKELYAFISKHLEEYGEAALRTTILSLTKENNLLKAQLEQVKQEASERIAQLIEENKKQLNQAETDADDRLAKLEEENQTLQKLVHFLTTEKQNAEPQPAAATTEDNHLHEPLEVTNTDKLNPDKTPKKGNGLKYLLLLLLGVGIGLAVKGISGLFGEKEPSVPTVTRQQLIGNMYTNDIWRRDELPQDYQQFYDKICSGDMGIFFMELGNGLQVKDTLFHSGQDSINPKWTRILEDMQVIRTEGSASEKNEMKSTIFNICHEGEGINLAKIAQATSEMRTCIAERKRQEEAQNREADITYMKTHDTWVRSDLKTAEFQTLYDKIAAGDTEYLLPIAKNIDSQPKEKTNGYWISACHELAAMEGNEAKLNKAREELRRISGAGNINLGEIRHSLNLINHPATQSQRAGTSSNGSGRSASSSSGSGRSNKSGSSSSGNGNRRGKNSVTPR